VARILRRAQNRDATHQQGGQQGLGLLISVVPDAQDPAHEVGVEVVSHADGHACPLVEREGKNIRRRPPALVNQKVARYSAVLWYCIGLPAKGEDRQEEVQACPFKGVVYSLDECSS